MNWGLSARLEQLEPWLAPWAAWLVSLYPQASVTSTRRTWSEQYALYRRAAAGQSRYPAAPPGSSLHEQGRAFDIQAPDEILEQLGAIWESVGGRWGGRFHDPIHFEA
jgi:hypothetical protein